MSKSVEEFSVVTLEIGGLGSALKALRLPFGKECRSIVDIKGASFTPVAEADSEDYFYGRKTESLVLVSNKDLQLLSGLVKSGDEHAKVLRGVIVWCEINAPRYWWQECDRYSVGACCLGSNSTMHQQGKGLKEDELVEMKENLPEGTMQKRIWTFTYQTLRRIYYQRKDHRLPQWREFCHWIEMLPFADELIICNGEDNNRDK